MTGRNRVRGQTGFTLPELLVAAVVLLSFVAVMLLLVRPANYDAERHNAERRLHLAAIMQAITEYHKVEGQLPPSITGEEKLIATQEDDSPTLCNDLVPAYMSDLPHDPMKGLKLVEENTCADPAQIFTTGYTVRIEGGRVILSAPATEQQESIQVERWFSLL